jgi:hypothetical protein
MEEGLTRPGLSGATVCLDSPVREGSQTDSLVLRVCLDKKSRQLPDRQFFLQKPLHPLI